MGKGARPDQVRRPATLQHPWPAGDLSSTSTHREKSGVARDRPGEAFPEGLRFNPCGDGSCSASAASCDRSCGDPFLSSLFPSANGSFSEKSVPIEPSRPVACLRQDVSSSVNKSEIYQPTFMSSRQAKRLRFRYDGAQPDKRRRFDRFTMQDFAGQLRGGAAARP